MLTKDQIIELRARAIARVKSNRVNPEDFEKVWPSYIRMAKATIEADERAGVLILLERGNKDPENVLILRELHDSFRVASGYLIQLKAGFVVTEYYWSWLKGEYMPKLEKAINTVTKSLFQRATTPVYQCAKKLI